jgi:ubiquitin-conjugating enzyme E2 D/E
MLTRIRKELVSLENEAPEGCTANPEGDDLRNWKARIHGPPDTPYEQGIYDLQITLPENYPFTPPTVKFVTPIFHPNIAPKSGSICLDILKDKWAPILTLAKTILSIRSLLADPNADDPLNSEAAALYKSNRQQFNQKVREMIRT